MAKLGRNQPCPCGSGRKVKLCCGTHRGPSPEDLAWQTLHDQARKFPPLLRPNTELDIDQLLERVMELPVHHYSLQSVSPGSGLQNWNDFEPASATTPTPSKPPQQPWTDQARASPWPARPPNSATATKIDLESLAIIIVDLARPIFLFISASSSQPPPSALADVPPPPAYSSPPPDPTNSSPIKQPAHPRHSKRAAPES